MPKPVVDFITVKTQLLEIGYYTLELVSLDGTKRILDSWYLSKGEKSEVERTYDFGTISSGMYFLVLKSPNRAVSTPVIVIK